MERLLKLDRRIIFLLVFVTVLAAVLMPFTLAIETSKLVRGVWEPIERLPPRAPVLVAIDFDPASQAELEPMLRAGMRQIFRKDLRMIAMTHWPTAVQMAKEFVAEAVAEFDDLEVEVVRRFSTRLEAERFIRDATQPEAATGTAGAAPAVPPGGGPAVGPRGRINVGRRLGSDAYPWRQALHEPLRAAKAGLVAEPARTADRKAWEVLRVLSRTPTLEYGKDYCFLGTKPGEHILVIGMGQSIPTAFPTDSRGTPTRSLPVMAGVESLRNIAYLLEIAAGSSAEWWTIYGANRYGFRMGVGCTAVMAPDQYPYVSAGMITGLCGGIKGAWEYEALVGTPGSATKAIPAQTVAHCLVIALILFCNVAYFMSRRRTTS